MNKNKILLIKNEIDFLQIEVYVPQNEYDFNLIDIIGYDSFKTMTLWFPIFVHFLNCANKTSMKNQKKRKSLIRQEA